MIICYWE